jgi:aminoacrylate hydrolase
MDTHMVDVDGIQIAYREIGEGSPVLLLSGLGGAGRGWGDQVDRFADRYRTIVPDHRGTGDSSKPADGYTIPALAADMAGLVRHLDTGPVHVVGSSTGGALAQLMALDHPDTVRSMVLVSSWAGPDAYFERQFAVRKAILESQGVSAYSTASALFLFAPAFARSSPDQVQSWVDSVSARPSDASIMAKRIDMIVAHDSRDRLGDLDVPCLVLVGADDICTPVGLSEELAGLIPGAELQIVAGGHLIYKERPAAFFDAVSRFISSH